MNALFSSPLPPRSGGEGGHRVAWRHLALLLLLAPLLGACASKPLGGSIAGSICKGIIERPEYAVKGATRYDQDWIDPTIESAGGACHWAPPAPRPPELDAQPAPKVSPMPAKKRGAWRRLSDRAHQLLRKNVWPKKPAAPVEPLPDLPKMPATQAPISPPPAAMRLPAPAVPMPRPRSALDELLFPAR